LEFLSQKIEKERSVIVSGTQYYLLYSKNYLYLNYIKNFPNQLYGIANHWLLIYAIENNKVLARDASLNFFGNIESNDFLNFWKGDIHVDELKNHPNIETLYINGYTYIKINRNLSLSEYKKLLLSIIKTVTHEFFNSRYINQQSNKKSILMEKLYLL